MTPAELYADVRIRISDLVRDLPEDRTRLAVPGCPGWTVHDVVAHSTGVVADVNAGRLDGAATDAWTRGQVDARRDAKTNDVLDEWAAEAATFEPKLDELPKAISRTCSSTWSPTSTTCAARSACRAAGTARRTSWRARATPSASPTL
jgi:hypothetical protein